MPNTATIEPRMTNVVGLVPDALKAMYALAKAAEHDDVPETTRYTVHLPDPVSDEIWDEAARHYDETALAALLVDIATINVWNRFNAATRQPAGAG